jgi:phosphoglycolate phosphatase
MPPIAVFFDMDGVLLDSFEAWLAVMNTAAIHFGCPPISRKAGRDAFGQSTAADAELFYRGYTAEDVEAFYIAHFREHETLATATPGAKSLLDDLDVRGIPTAVITNTHSQVARPLLEALDLIPHALIASDDVENPKPAPDMIFRGCQVLGLTPWDVLIVGDSTFDQQAAAAAGSPFAGIGRVGGNFTIAEISEVLSIIDGTHR